jgi:hypothetical protein
MTSCNDATEIDPQGIVLEENALNTVSNLQQGLTGVYSAISGSNVIAYSSRFTDDLKVAATNRGQGLQVHNWNTVANTNEPNGIWNNLYLVINRANRIIEASEGISAKNESEENTKTRILGECFAIRAFAHFELYRMFSQSYDMNALSVPIVDRVFVFEQPNRNTVEEVLNFIEDDLIEAESRLDLITDNNRGMSGLAAKALRARLALYAGNYPQAVALSTDVISNSSIATTLTEYSGIWTDDFEDEVIFKLARTAGQGRIGTLFTDLNGDIFFNPSISLFNELENGDYRTPIIVDLENSDDDITNLLVGKYLGNEANPGLNDIKILRTSEQYLIRAEANLRKDSPDLQAASTDMETLKNARKDFEVTVNYSNVENGLNDVLLERRLELAFEGHRMFDLRRYNLGVNRGTEGDECLNSIGACELDSDSYLFALPIPQPEIFANDNIEQNRNY